MQKAILVAVVVVAVLVIAWAMWPGEELGAPPAPEQSPVVTEPRPAPEPVQPAAPAPAPEPELVLPDLPDSDPFVRERLEPMHLPERWVAQGDYVRRLAVLAENATRGTYPRSQLAFLAPGTPFKVTKIDQRIYLDPVSYKRYDRYVSELVQVDPTELAGLLETLNPLVESALEEIGVDAPPGEVLAGAVREVLAVPVVEGDVELVQPNVTYQFADPELESLSPLKKQVLRMGPANVVRLQTYFRQLAAAMNLPQ